MLTIYLAFPAEIRFNIKKKSRQDNKQDCEEQKI